MNTASPAQLQDRHILITGAAGGIGRTLCEHIASRGAQVCALDRDTDGLSELSTKLGDKLGTLAADLIAPAELAGKLTDYQNSHGNFDGLINNAAFIYDIGSLRKTTSEGWHDEIDANLNGAYNVTAALLPQLATTGGSIVTIASVNALTSLGHPAYSAAKAGLVSFARAVAMEYGRNAVRSNIILPGTVATPAWRKRSDKDPQIFDKLAKWYPLGRVVEPLDVAKAASFLLSDEAAAISGATLNVDCGLMAGISPFASELTMEDMG